MKIKNLKKLVEITIVAAPLITTIYSCFRLYKKGLELEEQLVEHHDIIKNRLNEVDAKLLKETNISKETLKMIDNSMKNLKDAKKLDLESIKQTCVD